MKKADSKGFTLIELLVVIAIIGILAAIIIGSLNKSRERAKDAATVTQMSQMRAQATQYYIANNRSYGSTLGITPATQDSCKVPNSVFTEPGMANLVDGARKTAFLYSSNIKPVVCGSIGDRWIVYGTLYEKRSNGALGRFCVDSQGNAVKHTDKSFIYNERDPFYYDCISTR